MAEVPVYMALEDIRASLEVRGPQALKEPGKIVVHDNFLLINDASGGFHIVDNSNPESPVFESFVFLGTSHDVYAIDGYIYADQGPDITIWDMSNPSSPIFVSRLSNVMNQNLMKLDSFPIRFELKEIVEIDEDANCGGNGFFFGAEDVAVQNTGDGRSTVAGSLSRFTHSSGFLYVVDNNIMTIIDVTSPQKPIVENRISVNTGTETIYPYKGNLFIGTQFGMLIFDITQNPALPTFISQFDHMRGCDPVAVYDDLAYVTLRTGVTCGPAEDALHIIDISKINAPRLLATHLMSEPSGLAVSDSLLIICDGEAGLKTFDRRSTFNILDNRYSTLSNMNPSDVILRSGHAIITADEGIFQYNFQNPRNPVEISTLFSK